MDQPFKIRFDFPVANSGITIYLNATAQLHHSDPYYVVQDFYFDEAPAGQSYPSVLPPQEIKLIERNGVPTWVHRDSERESQLSARLGKAIDAMTR